MLSNYLYSPPLPVGAMLFPVQIVILITDGKSQDSVQEPAQRLRSQGVIVFAVGRRLGLGSDQTPSVWAPTRPSPFGL